ncbi:MAG: hypothetical protein HKP55_07320 [Gammaproteobacteria bacterium]|nr:hypothetical protein [Gammaproteobacteria bacterium]NNJ91466.1 hypothetical protein [Gammaproteobacteria bacterium]
MRIGTIGWLFESWDNSYFPEDIPQDWKLGYYANDLSAVVVPEALWEQADFEELEEMAEEVHEDFGFYFQIKTYWPSVEEHERLKMLFADNYFGFLVDCEPEKAPSVVNDRDFIFPAGIFPGAGCSWSLLEQAGSNDCVIRITAESDLRQLKQQFEQLASTVDFNRDALILVDLPEPRPDFIRQLRTLLELMMIA